jgi:hypothetical protein
MRQCFCRTNDKVLTRDILHLEQPPAGSLVGIDGASPIAATAALP